MILTIQPRLLSGQVRVIPSKSMAHRMLVCAALWGKNTQIECPETNNDINATVDCLTALGADIRRDTRGFNVISACNSRATATLNCGESGSTLRFMLPIAGALGVDATFQMSGRLPSRPLSPLWEEMERMGCRLSRPTPNTLRCQGQLRPGAYTISGSVSSQFITGLMFAHKITGGCTLEITGKVESAPYIRMTEQVLALFEGKPHKIAVEGDWSNGAFWLAAKALGSDLTVTGLDENSCQGDRMITSLLPLLAGGTPVIDAADIPDLVPILSVIAACQNGAKFINIARLRLKESDRVAAIIAMLENLGGKAAATEDTLTIYGTGLKGGTVDAFGDHRIAMSAAIAATRCRGAVTVLGAEAVSKSYPKFWDEYKRLGGAV